jgi:hypothetical protein
MTEARRGVQDTLAVSRWEAGVLASWVVVFTVLALHFPRSGDDWAWGSHEGPDRLRVFFQGLNGRYGGDLLILLLVRAGPLAAAVVSLVVVATLWLVLHLARARTPFGYAIVSGLFLLMPVGVWREGVVWLSGFVNYAVSALVLTAFLAIAQTEWLGTVARTWPRLALVAAVGFVGQTFMEHVSLAICVLSVVLVILHRWNQGRWPIYTSTWAIAAVCGAVVMFANPAYRNAASGRAYQQVQATSGDGALTELVRKGLDTLSTQAVVDNVALNVLLVALVIILIVSRRGLAWARGGGVIAGAVVILLVMTGLALLERTSNPPTLVRALAGVAAVGLLGLLVLVGSTLVRPGPRRWAVLTACGAVVCMVGPLLLVNPIGPRCFYPTYIALLIVIASFAGEVRDERPTVERTAVTAPLALLSVALMLHMMVVYFTIHGAVDRRLDHVRAVVAAGHSKVTIRPLPYSDHLHDGDPYWSLLQTRFKAYYGFPPELKVRLVPNPWLKTPEHR